MANTEKNHVRLKALNEIMLNCTDDDHFLTMNEILTLMSEKGFSSKRQTISNDFEKIKETFGTTVEQVGESKNTKYHVVNRAFTKSDIILLVDAVQSSQVISVEDTEKLIKKLEKFTSDPLRRTIQDNVTIFGRAKTFNPSFQNVVAVINDAMSKNRQIVFKYYCYDENKKLVPRHNGKYYKISPWGKLWKDDRYYMIGFDSEAGIMKNYRIDKIGNVAITEDKRESNENSKKFNAAEYAKSHFDMFSGDVKDVTLEVKNEARDIIIDQFGKDLIMIPKKDSFTVSVKVAVNPPFFAWLFSKYDIIKILSPDDVKREAVKEAENFIKSVESPSGK